MLKKERADFILTRLNELYPETPVPLDHKNNFTLLVAVLLSAQCTDERVNKVTPSLFKLADNPYDMQHIPVEKIYKVVRPCGLAPQKILCYLKTFNYSCRTIWRASAKRFHQSREPPWRRTQNCRGCYVSRFWIPSFSSRHTYSIDWHNAGD